MSGRTAPTRFFTTLAGCDTDVRAAQRLRYRVFAEELGARLPADAGGVDRDAFDEHCDHLLLRERGSGTVVGTYRLLPADRALRAGGFYSATEFDLGRLPTLPALVEIGRACVLPAYRSGSALATMLGGLARHIRARGYQHVIGCASIHAHGDLARTAALCDRLVREHASPAEWRVRPYRRFDVRPGRGRPEAPTPGLLRGYLRMGARVCGPPAWDDDFGTADLLLLLPMARLTERFSNRFLRAA